MFSAQPRRAAAGAYAIGDGNRAGGRYFHSNAVTFAGVDPDRSRLLADTAIRAAAAHSASDDHLVARAFRDMTEERERIQLLRCLYVVAAADEHISTVEDNEIFEVATAIGVRRTDVVALRMEFKEYLGSLKALPSER